MSFQLILFTGHRETKLQELEDMPRMKIDGKMKYLKYANVTVLIIENEEEVQNLLNIVKKESRKKRTELNGN